MKTIKVCSLVAGVVVLASTVAPVFAGSRTIELSNKTVNALGAIEKVEGGIWEHEVSESKNAKSVFSNYFHDVKRHSSSCRLGIEVQGNPTYKSSGEIEPGSMAYSSTSGPANKTAYANYNTY